MSSKFKVGDEIVIVKDGIFRFTTVGQTGIIHAIDPDNYTSEVRITNPNWDEPFDQGGRAWRISKCCIRHLTKLDKALK